MTTQELLEALTTTGDQLHESVNRLAKAIEAILPRLPQDESLPDSTPPQQP